MVRNLKKLNETDIRELKYDSPRFVDWWTSGFTQDSGDFDVYVDYDGCDTSDIQKDAYIALDRYSSTAYYWCSGIRE